MTEVRFIIEELIICRRENRLSQQQVAAKMLTTQSAVSAIESGRNQPRLPTLIRYANACGMDLQITLRHQRDPEGGEAK